ncbi:Na+-transporting NADH:ubiquinone oxidoreductase subunit C [Dethiosulfatibacter aminovorans DSM 17477]|uniref:Ion-translocating oxidoreductase complex subunit G n=1 Tax=Dethiosulfatibacter aminovorans DSM 17477 TaxID=1121476 RepID=A0A1M6AFN6_9FIRM|nr:FMN-binding protein [Dethiosulfatibacter aminovorans]SHI35108.1 Na+-transporting NADH:ubiquinone oxidoreductase subunit C [Dethiosulfatibacter aminovorans DSM 17477]
MPRKKKILYPVVFMVSITVFFTLILAGVNELSIRTIARQEKLKIQTKVLNSLGLEHGDNEDEIIRIYNETITEKEIDGWKYYKSGTGDSVTGYAFMVEGAGLWGMIEGIVALDSEFSAILGVEFISHSETPGLGGRIEEEWFIEQFRDIPIKDYENGRYLVFRPSTGGNVDAISGATITSKAVLKMFNDSIDEILKIREDVI